MLSDRRPVPVLVARAGIDEGALAGPPDDGAAVPHRILVEHDDRRLEIAVEAGARTESRPCSYGDRAQDLALAQFGEQAVGVVGGTDCVTSIRELRKVTTGAAMIDPLWLDSIRA